MRLVRLFRVEQSGRRARLLAHGRVTIQPPPVCPPAVAAEQEHPRLRIWRSPTYLDWWWQVDDPGGRVISTSVADSHAQALAVGLAALEVASVSPTGVSGPASP